MLKFVDYIVYFTAILGDLIYAEVFFSNFSGFTYVLFNILVKEILPGSVQLGLEFGEGFQPFVVVCGAQGLQDYIVCATL